MLPAHARLAATAACQPMHFNPYAAPAAPSPTHSRCCRCLPRISLEHLVLHLVEISHLPPVVAQRKVGSGVAAPQAHQRAVVGVRGLHLLRGGAGRQAGSGRRDRSVCSVRYGSRRKPRAQYTAVPPRQRITSAQQTKKHPRTFHSRTHPPVGRVRGRCAWSRARRCAPPSAPRGGGSPRGSCWTRG